jgi:hypothetical protein
MQNFSSLNHHLANPDNYRDGDDDLNALEHFLSNNQPACRQAGKTA